MVIVPVPVRMICPSAGGVTDRLTREVAVAFDVPVIAVITLAVVLFAAGIAVASVEKFAFIWLELIVVPEVNVLGTVTSAWTAAGRIVRTAMVKVMNAAIWIKLNFFILTSTFFMR
jgi:hypothetical protein